MTFKLYSEINVWSKYFLQLLHKTSPKEFFRILNTVRNHHYLTYDNPRQPALSKLDIIKINNNTPQQ